VLEIKGKQYLSGFKVLKYELTTDFERSCLGKKFSDAISGLTLMNAFAHEQAIYLL
jgi:hypothetical protein